MPFWMTGGSEEKMNIEAFIPDLGKLKRYFIII
jgi:hypothetical protein